MRRLVCHNVEWQESSSYEYVDHFSNAQLFHTVKVYADFVLWTGYLTNLKWEYCRYKEVWRSDPLSSVRNLVKRSRRSGSGLFSR